MAVLDFPFTCPNGHSFRANAKLRARCPTCTQLARRTGKEGVEFAEGSNSNEAKPEAKPIEKPIHKPPSSPIARVLRQGRPRMPVKKPVAPKVPVKASVKTPIKKLASTSANGLVTRQRAARGHTPVVRKMPKKFARAKTTETGKARPFWEEVAERVKFW